MHRRTPFTHPLLLSILTLCILSSRASALVPSDLVVVYNRNLKASHAVASHYADRRGVPRSNLIGVDVPTSEEIYRTVYENVMLPPIRSGIARLQDQQRQPAVLLVYGIPLRVQDRVNTDLETAFEDVLVAKLGECQETIQQLARELDRLVPEGEAERPQVKPREGATKAEETLAQAAGSVSRALRYMATSRADGGEEEIRLKISSILIRLTGTSTAVKAFAEGLSLKREADRQELQRQILFKWNAILTREAAEKAFRGVLPDEALLRATSIRVTEGLLGELRYWRQLQIDYSAGETSAAVDSELALVLAESFQQARWLPNPFHDRYERLPFIEKIRRQTIRVCRLDGPTPKAAKRLVDVAVATEATGLKGIFYIDARGLKGKQTFGSYAWYDRHLLNLHKIPKDRADMKVVLDDSPELFGPGACPDAALYCGWYSLAKYVDSFRWQKGAVGFHAASAEARTLKQMGSQVWCKRMTEEGVAATLGPVQEPYLASFPLPDHFFPLLMSGEIPLLEVYFRTIPHVSWRQLLIGDPLYTPFKKTPSIRLPSESPAALVPE